MQSTYYEKNKERILSTQRERRETNEHVKRNQKQYARQYYQCNKDRIKDRYKQKMLSLQNNESITIEKRQIIITFD